MFARLCAQINPTRYHGGWRMQLEQRAADPDPEPLPPPRSALRHLLSWGTGYSSAANVVWHMSDLIADGESTHPMVRRLGALEPGKATKGFLDLLGEQCGFQALLRDVPGALVHSICPPSVLLRFLHDKAPTTFLEAMGMDDQEKLAGFWSELLPKSEELRSHRCFAGTSRAQWGRIVPLTLHEDAGPFTKKLSVNCISFAGLFGVGGETLCNHLICSYIKDGPASPEELDDLWRPVLSEFDELAHTGLVLSGVQWIFIVYEGRPRGPKQLLGATPLQWQRTMRRLPSESLINSIHRLDNQCEVEISRQYLPVVGLVPFSASSPSASTI